MQEWRPFQAQEPFLACSAFEALYGGAAGGGKSQALLYGALRYVGRPGYRALILRREFRELERTLLARSREVYPLLGARWAEKSKAWVFPGGGIVEFGHAEHELDVHQYQGAEYQNISFDELTHFTEYQYTYLISRLRSTRGIPLRLRSTTNPGGPGHDWVLARFAPWLYPIGEAAYDGPHASPGERLHYRRDAKSGDQIICDPWWHDRTCDLCVPGTACPAHRPRARAFFPARVADNPYLAGTEYEANLDDLDAVSRAQLKEGNWMAVASEGAYFKRAYFQIVEVAPAFVLSRIRYWDRAATAGGGDFTAGVLLSRTAQGLFYIEDIVRGQWGPGDVERTIETTSDVDPVGTRLVLERDPAQAGKVEKAYYMREFAGRDICFVPPQGDKITRARPVSAQAEVGNIRLVRGRWNEALLRELEAFPKGHDDQVDALSGAFHQSIALSGGRKSTTRGKREMPARREGA